MAMHTDGMIRLEADDGHVFDAYEQHPDSARASVVVVQEIFGVNAHIRSVIDRYAAAGYHAIAPAIFDRAERNVELDYDAEGIERGRSLAVGIGMEAVMTDVAAAVAHAAGTGPVGIVGYCFGGSVAWLAAGQLPVAAAVGYYGSRVPDSLDSKPRVPTMLHFGELDAGIPFDGVATIQPAHPDVIVHVYEGAGHGFNCDARASFHRVSADLARERTLAFLAEHLVAR
jgi:carboxymethylenebutenolidase